MALYEAARAATRGVVGAFVVCEEQWRVHDDARVKVDFWIRNLHALAQSLKRLRIPLVVAHAEHVNEIADRLLSVVRDGHCDAIYFNYEYEVDERRRDNDAARRLAEAGVQARGFHDRVLFDPASVSTDEGRCYSVFTPFKRRVLLRLQERPVDVLPEPACQSAIEVQSTPIPIRIDGWGSQFDPSDWPAGEDIAHMQLLKFGEQGMCRYSDDRDFPSLEGTSRLSPYLCAGVLSPRQCLDAAVRSNSGRYDDHGQGLPGAAQWISELLWREFYQHILVGYPRVSMHRAFKPYTDRIRWAESPEHFARWSEGRTGVPIVDAGMRQLLATGWMHNRVRMITAMYLSKDLFLDWRLGESHFMRHLVDGDLGSNNGGWQWCASTGCDAAPYFRIFNPVTQSERFDASGNYIRKWVPELSAVGGRAIHDPSKLQGISRAGLDYPAPLVERSNVRARVIAAFQGASLRTT